MALEVPVNTNSLRLVDEELKKTLLSASDKFETFLSERHNLSLLEQADASIHQVAGTLDLLQVPGASLIASEIHQLLQFILNDTSDREISDKLLTDLSTAFFVLPKYLEFIGNQQADYPVLAVPQANDLRAGRGAPALTEASFITGDAPLFSQNSNLAIPTQHTTPEEREATFKRLRHMYQVGLLGAIRDSQLELHLRLMGRAVQRLSGQLPQGAVQRFWILAHMVLDSMQHNGLEINSSRKRLLTRLDKEFRRLSAGGGQIPPDTPDDLERELTFLVQITSYREGSVGRFLQSSGIQASPILDHELANYRRQMLGPGFDTLNSVVNELRAEMRSAKDMLEILMQSSITDEEELLPLMVVLDRMADVMGILNLPTLAELLDQLSGSLKSINQSTSFDPSNLYADIADALLFVESSLEQLDRQKLSQSELQDISQEKRQEITSGNLLAEATELLFKESESGIGLAKRAITSYADSGFDTTHLMNVGNTLNAMRGAFFILNDSRATAVLKAAVKFINDFIESDKSSPEEKQKVLETLADALISLEYYINELAQRRHADANILKIAEESLAALGYAVDQV